MSYIDTKDFSNNFGRHLANVSLIFDEKINFFFHKNSGAVVLLKISAKIFEIFSLVLFTKILIVQEKHTNYFQKQFILYDPGFNLVIIIFIHDAEREEFFLVELNFYYR